MKKQFFYAAMAVALMASCTSEDNLTVDPVNPTPEDDKVEIKLGVDAPSVTATSKSASRSTGSVGDETGANNVWNSQKLYITMIDRATGTVAVDPDSENGDAILSHTNYVYYAPRKSEQTSADTYGKGDIRIYTDELEDQDQYNAETDKGIIKHVYYPANGKFDFLGWHLDDAAVNVAADDEAGVPGVDGYTVTMTANEKSVNNIKLNGHRDIMGARTTDRSTDNTVVTNDLLSWLYSARTARNEVHPVLKFQHQLARLKFFVRAGSESASDSIWDATQSKWTERPTVATTVSGITTEAMYVTGLTVNKMTDAVNMNLAAVVEGKDTILTTAATGASTTAIFTLGSYDENTKQIVDLKPVAPEYEWKKASAESQAYFKPNYKGTQIGESILFFPDAAAGSAQTVELTLDLAQWVKNTEDESWTDQSSTPQYTYILKEQPANLKVHARSVKVDQSTFAKVFEAGKSYNVFITIYGFERIEVSAELTAWEDGGDVEVDIEEEESVIPGYTTTFDVKDAEGNAITNATITWSFEDGTATGTGYKVTALQGTIINYTVECEGYEDKEGQITVGSVDATEPVILTAVAPDNENSVGGEEEGGE